MNYQKHFVQELLNVDGVLNCERVVPTTGNATFANMGSASRWNVWSASGRHCNLLYSWRGTSQVQGGIEVDVLIHLEAVVKAGKG